MYFMTMVKKSGSRKKRKFDETRNVLQPPILIDFNFTGTTFLDEFGDSTTFRLKENKFVKFSSYAQQEK